MTDQATNPGHVRAHHQPRTPTIEYRIYFAIIFLISLPWALVKWLVTVGERDPERPAFGFVGLAWRQAKVVTPLIFSA
jgi:hypothetical protein